MVSLQPALQQKIAQMVSSYLEDNRVYALVGIGGFETGSFGHDDKLFKIWKKAMGDDLFQEQYAKYGSDWGRSRVALNHLLKRDKISSAEAAAYFFDLFPQERFSSSEYGDLFGSVSGQQSVDALAAPTEDPQAQEQLSGLQLEAAIYNARGSIDGRYSGANGVGLNLNFQIPKLPTDYDQLQTMHALRYVSDQLGVAIGSVASGNVRFADNTIPGESLIPGSVGTRKLDPFQLARVVRDIPGPDQAVEFNLAPDDVLDREFVSGNKRGMGRVWRVTSVKYPPDYEPTVGPARYRCVFPGIQFGVMSLTFSIQGGTKNSAQFTTVDYGIIIRNIPHFLGRIPSQILFADYVGHPPVTVTEKDGSYGSVLSNAFGGFTQRLFDRDRGEANYGSGGLYYEDILLPLGSGDVLDPISNDTQLCQGFKFTMIKGRDADEVYSILNSRVEESNVHLRGNARGNTASSPANLLVEPPTYASGVIKLNSTTEQLRPRQRDLASANERWRHGFPFSFETCQALRATDDHFSLVVQPDMLKLANPGNDNINIAFADDHGVKVVNPPGRTIAVDIVVV